jgi:hypothetical protein
MNKFKISQIDMCNKLGYPYEEVPTYLKVGISSDINNSGTIIHALRHSPVGDTSGWYIWSGTYSEDDDFFQPLHIIHLEEWCPLIIPFLGLPVGTRVLIAENGNYVDVWEDSSLF